MRLNRVLVLVLIVLWCGLSPVSAGEFKDWLKRSNGEHYQQTGLQMVDPRGDAYLIRKLDQIPWKLLKTLVGGSYPQAEIEKERELQTIETAQKIGQAEDPLKIGRTKPIHIPRLINAIHRVILEEYPAITPVMGEEHAWSPEAHRYLWFGFWHRVGRFIIGKQKEFPTLLFMRSKIFLLLACGWTSRYAVTGQEPDLEQWIMSQPDRSIQLHELFRESYLLNKGNMYLSMLTAENVLASDPYRVDRGESPLQQKLAYIRHDSQPLGDNYGAWYHFFGIGMYGLIRAPFVARAVAEIESFGSLFLEGKDKQEDYINRYGAIFGRQLNRLIEKELWKQPLPKDARYDYMLPVTEKSFKK